MKQTYLKSLFLSLLMIVVGINVASAQTRTLWQEDFSSYSANDVPSGGTYNYVCKDGGSTTKIYNENTGGGTAPELLVSKTGGTFSATVPLSNIEGDLTLTFTTNKQTIKVHTTTEGITGGVEEKLAGTHTVTFSGITPSMTEIKIVFTGSGSSNVRLDDIKLVWNQPISGDFVLDRISLDGDYPTTFNVGDSFSHEGITVTATYVDESTSEETTSDVTSSATFSEPDMTTAGTKTVTVSYTEGDVTKTATYNITVNTVPVTGVSLGKTEANLLVGKTLTLIPTIAPENATNKSCTWSSDHPEFATVEDGVVTGVAEGTATIRVTTDDGSFTATCNVTVIGELNETTATGNLNNSDTGVFAGQQGFNTGAHSVSGTLVTDAGNVTVDYAGTSSTYLNDTHIRMYKNGSTLKFTAPTGYTLTKIVLTKTQSDGGEYSYIKSEQGSYSSGTWTGDEEYVTFTGIGDDGGTVRLASAEVTLEKAGVKYSLTLSDTENGTVTIKDASGAELQSGVKLKEGTKVTIEAAPAVGYLFDGWTSTPDGIIDDATSATTKLTMPAGDVALSASFIIDQNVQHYNITWSVNGTETTTEVVENEEIDFAAPENVPAGYSFVGWVEEEIDGVVTDAPTYVTEATATADKTYYAVLSSGEMLAQTLTYDGWTYSGATTDKKSYRLFGEDAYVESAEFDLSTLSKVVIYGGRFGQLTDQTATGEITDGTNLWKTFNLTGTNNAKKHEFTGGTGLSGTGKLRIASTCGDGENKGLRISKIEIYTKELPETYYFTTIPEKVQMNITSAMWATYVPTEDVLFPSEVKAYVVTNVSEGNATATQVESVTAGTPVIVNGDAGTHTLIKYANASAPTANMLLVSDGNVTGDGTIYVLAVEGGQAGFAPLSNGKKLSAGKAYLQVDNASGAKINLIFDGESSDIRGIENAVDFSDGDWYNLQGMKVTNPQRGIYIHNGKKVVIK